MVSVLTLQYVWVTTFGNGVASHMLPACAATTFIFWALLVIQSLTAVVKAVALVRCVC